MLVALGGLVRAQDAHAEVSGWLGGRPDAVERQGRCHLYGWFLAQADAQTGGRASSGKLARRRLLNVANKLADHHRAGGGKVYSATIRYLALGGDAPAHFSFTLDRAKLDALLSRPCTE